MMYDHSVIGKPIGQRIRTITGRSYSQRMGNQLMKNGDVLNRNGFSTTKERSRPCAHAARPSNYSSMNFLCLEDIHSRNHPRWSGLFARTRIADTRVKSVAVVVYRYQLRMHGVWARSHGREDQESQNIASVVGGRPGMDAVPRVDILKRHEAHVGAAEPNGCSSMILLRWWLAPLSFTRSQEIIRSRK